MTEPAAKYETGPRTEMCCPFCGSHELFCNEWTVGDDHPHLGPDEFGEVWAWECSRCLGSAPMVSWEKRADPWQYPPDMPTPGQRIILVYKREDGEESLPISSTVPAGGREGLRPVVRWMEIPEAKL